MRKEFLKSNLAGLLSLTFVLAACGQAERPVSQLPAPITPGAASCPAGQTRIGDGPCITGDFRTACQDYRTMGILTSINGVEVCKVTGSHWKSITGNNFGFPAVTPSNPSGTTTSSTNITVRPNDKITVDNVNGSWGGTSAEFKKLLGFIPTTIWTTDCKQISADGTKSGSQVIYEGQPAGFFGSDGTQSFFIGKGIANFPISTGGTLRFGFNAPDPYTSCGSVSFRVVITHCEDALGNSYLCP